MKRKIIEIDEAKCNGCGNCVTGCAEGALKIVNGKAKLVKEQFCDGFGDCIKECPTGALKIVERESQDYNPVATQQHVMQTRGVEGVQKFKQAAQAHDKGHHGHGAAEHAALHAMGGCPGSRMRFTPGAGAKPAATTGAAPASQAIRSELEQWPVQIHLVQPDAPFFKNRELVVLSTCSPVASADVHWRFIRGRAVAVGCPKLDDTEPYADKLGAILAEPSIPKVIVVRMEVPCCGGLSMIVREAVEKSGRSDLQAEEVTVGLNGDIVAVKPL